MTRTKLLCIYSIIVLFVLGCEKEKDKYFEKPDWLQGPIYQQLQSEGRFNKMIACINRTEYKNILSRTGYFTIFAPNDEAFDAFLTEKGLTAVKDLDDETVKSIVEYAVIQNGYNIDHLGDNQDPNEGWVPGIAYKRQTRRANYQVNEQVYHLGYGFYINNYINPQAKYIPYFLDEYFNTEGLTEFDYNQFFPDVEYTGFNVVDAKAVSKEIIAENGYIYELDKVILPLPNIDEQFRQPQIKDEYNLFYGLLQRVARVDSIEEDDDTYKYIKRYGRDQVTLTIGINNEYKTSDYENSDLCQIDGWTVFAPNNATYYSYVANTLLKYYKDLELLITERPSVIRDFIEAHLYTESIWPSQYNKHTDAFGLTLTASNIVTSQMCSNGFFYGTNVVLLKGNKFNSVYGQIYLNPKYTIMYTGINNAYSSFINVLTSKEIQQTLFVAEDTTFVQEGWTLSEVSGFDPTKLTDRMTEFQRLMAIHAARGEIEFNEIFTGSGYIETFSGDYIQYDKGKIYGPGNLEEDSPAMLMSSVSGSNNGNILVLSKPILPPKKTYSDILNDPPATASYSKFAEYFNAATATVYNGKIINIDKDEDVTILVPTDELIDAAGLPAPTATDSTSLSKINRFVQYHIIPSKKIFTINGYSGTLSTLMFERREGKLDIYGKVTFGDSSGSVQIIDKTGSSALITDLEASNIMSVDNAVIHQIDKVLKYE